MTFGIVVEGEYDSAVYSTLIRRIRTDTDNVLSRPCGGVASLRKEFVGWLKNFQWMATPQVEKALVICDSDCRDPASVENELARVLDQSGFRTWLTLPVHFYATRCMVETWLVADERAVTEVARKRGKTGVVRRADDPLEGERDVKERFRGMLSEASLPATTAVYAEISGAADVDRIAERCPYFRQFIEHVRAC